MRLSTSMTVVAAGAVFAARIGLGADVVTLASGTELRGRLMCEVLHIATPDGQVNVPSSSVVLVTQAQGRAEVVLVGGAHIAGTLEPSTVPIELGLYSLSVDLGQVASIIFDPSLRAPRSGSSPVEFMRAAELEGIPRRFHSDGPFRVEVPLRSFRQDPRSVDIWRYSGLNKTSFDNVTLGLITVEVGKERWQFGATLIVELWVEKSVDKRVDLSTTFIKDGRVLAQCSRQDVDAEEKKSKRVKMGFGVNREELRAAFSEASDSVLRITVTVATD